MKKQLDKHMLVFYSLIILSLLIVCSPLFVKECYYNALSSEAALPYTGWTYIRDDGTQETIKNFPVVLSDKANRMTAITNVVPNTMKENQYLFFRSINQEIKVYINGENIYEFGTKKPLSFINSPGSNWNKIALTPDMGGKQIRIETISAYSNFSGFFSKIHIASQSQLTMLIFKESIVNMLSGSVLLFIGIICFITSLLYRKVQSYKVIKCVGLFYVFMSLWILGESKGLSIIINNPTFILLILLFSKMLSIISFLYLLKYIASKHTRQIHSLIYATNFAFLLGIAVQMLTPFDFIQMLFIADIIISLFCFIFIVYKVKTLVEKRFNKYALIDTLFSFIVILGVLIDIFKFNKMDFSGIGLGKSIGVCTYMLFTAIYFVRKSAETELNAVKAKDELTKVSTSLLLSQIKPHFLYNSLNSISYLCKTDSQKANEAIIMFSKFLRNNMNSIENRSMIPFQSELNHIENYLYLESIRFPNTKIDYQLNFVDFDIPSLTLQPIVENAIKHGVSKKCESGQVIIKTSKENNCVIITVEDDGVGFDVTQVDSSKSIGLANIQKRLEIMCNAKILITSKMNVGTVVKIEIPLPKEGAEYEGRLFR